MNKFTEFEELYYKQEGLYEIMDPNKFYDDIEEYVENVQKQS
jgi:hypothetical protein